MFQVPEAPLLAPIPWVGVGPCGCAGLVAKHYHTPMEHSLLGMYFGKVGCNMNYNCQCLLLLPWLSAAQDGLEYLFAFSWSLSPLRLSSLSAASRAQPLVCQTKWEGGKQGEVRPDTYVENTLSRIQKHATACPRVVVVVGGGTGVVVIVVLTDWQ